MKKITIVICIFLLLFSITGCESSKSNINMGKKSNIEIKESKVNLSIKENTLTNTGATIILRNDSDDTIQYGNPYEIEVKKNNDWYKIDVTLNFTLPAYELKSKESKEIKLNWENSYGKLEKGTYRIIKSVDVKRTNDKFNTYFVSAEFTIK